MRDKIFYALSFGFLMGVLARSFLFISFHMAALMSFVSLAALAYLLLVRERRWGTITSVFLLALSLGVLRFHAADIPPPQVFETRVDKAVDLAGVIADELVIADTNQRIVVETGLAGKKTKILISTGFDAMYEYGNKIDFTGLLRKPENFATDQGKEFDYMNYLRKDGIRYVMYYPDITIVSGGYGNPLKAALFRARRSFLDTINTAIPSPENLLMGGLILGERAAFSDELRQAFIDTGTIHIVALSGYNVTIVSEWIMRFLGFLPRNAAFGAGILSVFIFVLMTGASSTAVRAGIMAALALVARATGREYDIGRALVLAALAMVLANPLILAHDVSFQLSFLATVAVIFFAPRVEKYFLRVPKRFGLRDIVSVTTAAYVFVFPFILYQMGNLSLVSLPANFLILPFVPLTMAAGFAVGLFGLIWHGLAVPFGAISYLLLHYELGMITFFASFPFAAFAVPDFPLLLTVCVYAWFAYVLFGSAVRGFFAW